MRYEQEGYTVHVTPGDPWNVELRGEVDLDFQVSPPFRGAFNDAHHVESLTDYVIELLPDLEAVKELLGEDLLAVY